jgi:hypothetical protein
MKQLLVILSLMVASSMATAGEREHGGGSTAVAGAAASASSSATAAGGAGGSVEGGRSLLLAAPSMPAPAVTNIGCPPVVIGSDGISFVVVGWSGTKEPKLVAFCVAMALNQPAVAETIACNASKEYRAANPACSPKPVAVSDSASAERKLKWEANQAAKARGEEAPYGQEHFQ